MQPGLAETLPTLMMVVDQNLRIKRLNEAAAAFLGSEQAQARHRRGGEAFQCVHHRDSSNGCGHGRFCQLCPIREAATQALREQRVVRRRTKAEVGEPGQAREVHLLVTATPLPTGGPTRVLLVLEDISALVMIQDPVAICTSCKRVREDGLYWEQMEAWFRQHLDLDLSHGLCPQCRRDFYGKLGNRGTRPVVSRRHTAARH